MNSIRHFFKEAIQGFVRNPSTAFGSVITIFLSLLIVGVFLVAGTMLDKLMTNVESNVSVTCYVSDSADDATIKACMKDIESFEGVKEVGFTDKAAALEKFSNSMTGNPEIIDQLDGNPLPASIDIELSDPKLVEDVVDQIASNANYIKVTEDSSKPLGSIKYGQGTVEKLFKLTNYARIIGIAMISILVFIALVFINNTIRLAILARRKEIAIMRLVGASNGFIRGPFLMEGALDAIIGSALACGVIEVVRRFAMPALQDSIKFLNFAVDGSVYFMIYVVLFVFGILLGILGSLLAMRKYLKV